MSIDKTSVDYMKGYLKYALEFEKYVYVWSQSLEIVNERMRQIYNERQQLEKSRLSTQQSLSALSSGENPQRKFKEGDAQKCKKRVKTTKTILWIILIFLFALGCLIGAIMHDSLYSDLEIKKGIFISLIGLFTVFIGSLCTGVLPICIGVIIVNKSKAEKLIKEAKQLTSENTVRRKEVLLKAKEDDIDNNWSKNIAESTAITKKQDEICEALQKAKTNLKQIYSLNVLPQKYRNLNAVATLYEYLETERCNTVSGHGGIYDTYDIEQLAIEHLRQQIITNQTLSRIEDNQRYLCQEMQNANRTLSQINLSINKIEKSTDEIAKNTAISAVANQQTAAAANWITWRMWANGY